MLIGGQVEQGSTKIQWMSPKPNIHFLIQFVQKETSAWRIINEEFYQDEMRPTTSIVVTFISIEVALSKGLFMPLPFFFVLTSLMSYNELIT